MAALFDGLASKKMFLDFSQAGRSVGRAEGFLLTKLCGVGKEFVYLKAKQLVAASAQTPFFRLRRTAPRCL